MALWTKRMHFLLHWADGVNLACYYNETGLYILIMKTTYSMLEHVMDTQNIVEMNKMVIHFISQNLLTEYQLLHVFQLKQMMEHTPGRVKDVVE
eukprot:275508-Ditylum_brightwellii.AAC.1